MLEAIICFVPFLIIGAGLFVQYLVNCHREKKYPINRIGMFVFPMPDDPRWKRAGEKKCTLSQITVWGGTCNDIYVGGENVKECPGVKKWQIDRYCNAVLKHTPPEKENSEIRLINKIHMALENLT